MKKIITRMFRRASRLWRGFVGIRTLILFGFPVRFSAATMMMPLKARVLPETGVLDDIVRYSDTIQMHAAVRFLHDVAHPPIVIDVGAHHGVYAIVLGKMVAAKGGRLIAVEPNSDSFAILQENVSLNRLTNAIICERVALADESGQAVMSGQSFESFLLRDGKGGQDTKVTTLKAIMEKHGLKNVDLLMVDVEGAELLVLQGWPSEQSLPEFTLCELHSKGWSRYGYSGSRWRQFLSERNLVCIDSYWRVLSSEYSEDYIGPVRLVERRLTERAPVAEGA